MPTYGVMAWDAPDVFKGNVAVRGEGFPYITGTAFSSHAPASWWFQPVNALAPIVVNNVWVFKSFNAVVPQATSANSSGSEGYTYAHGISVFQRQDNGANSTNLSLVKTGLGQLTATMSYSSGSQSFGMSWLTDTTGGAATFSTTSGAGNWSSYATGIKAFQVPIGAALAPGEYFIAHQHSSTTATSNSNVTLLSVSNLHVAPLVNTYGLLGNSSASIASVAGPVGLGNGVASAVTTNATMAASVVSASVVNNWVMNFSAV
jgi:hypothetical protein